MKNKVELLMIYETVTTSKEVLVTVIFLSYFL